MTNKKKDDLAPFQDYLQNQLGYSPTTTTVYASYIRKMIYSIPNITENTLKTYFENIENKTVRMNSITSWRKFCIFYKSIFNIDLPSIQKQTREKIVYNVPSDIWTTFEVLKQKNKAKLEVLCNTKFEDLIPKGNYYEVQNKEQNWKFHILDKASVDKIIKWSNPLRESTIPLFPEYPMSTKAIPLVALKRLYREHKRHLD